MQTRRMVPAPPTRRLRRQLGSTPRLLRGPIEWLKLVAGRLFDDAELQGSAKVAVLGQTVAAELFGQADPMGRTR